MTSTTTVDTATFEGVQSVLDAHEATLCDAEQHTTFARVKSLIVRSFQTPPTLDGVVITNPFLAYDVRTQKNDAV